MLIITVWNGPLVKLLYLSRYLLVCIRDRVQVLVQILDLIWTQRNLMLTQWSRCPGEVEVEVGVGGAVMGGMCFNPGLDFLSGLLITTDCWFSLGGVQLFLGNMSRLLVAVLPSSLGVKSGLTSVLFLRYTREARADSRYQGSLGNDGPTNRSTSHPPPPTPRPHQGWGALICMSWITLVVLLCGSAPCSGVTTRLTSGVGLI